MPNLRRLDLSHTQIGQWPRGLFAHPRNDAFDLNLTRNPIRALPTLTPEPTAARTVARTRLDRNTLNDDQRTLYERYRNEAGLDPYRTYEPQGSSDPWLEGVDANTRLSASSCGTPSKTNTAPRAFSKSSSCLSRPSFSRTPRTSSATPATKRS